MTFLKVDLSRETSDFERIALEPGLPMLDSTAGSGELLRRWLGDFAAEADFQSDGVEFHAVFQGRRQLDAVPRLASTDDPRPELREELALFRQRIAEISPSTDHERLLADYIAETAQSPDRLFRYQQADGTWKLVWCWGFARRDAEPGPATICQRCQSGPWLYIARTITESRCRGCRDGHVANVVTPERSRKRIPAIATAALLLAMLAAVGWWSRSRPNEEIADAKTPQQVTSTTPTAAMPAGDDETSPPDSLPVTPTQTHKEKSETAGTNHPQEPFQTVGNSSDVTDDSDPDTRPSLSVEPRKLVLNVGERRLLDRDIRLLRESAPLEIDAGTISIDQPEIARLEGNTVIALTPGSATLTIGHSDSQVTLPIRVLEQKPTRMIPSSQAAAPDSPTKPLPPTTAIDDVLAAMEDDHDDPEPERRNAATDVDDFSDFDFAPPPAAKGSSDVTINVTEVVDDSQHSTVKMTISIPATPLAMEFRVVDDSSDEPAAWTTGQANDDNTTAQLQTPPLVRKSGRLHRVIIESRIAGTDEITRYTWKFQLESQARDNAVEAQ